MTKKLLTLALMFALVAPIALAILPPAQAAPISNSPAQTQGRKHPKPTPRPRPQGPTGSDDE